MAPSSKKGALIQLIEEVGNDKPCVFVVAEIDKSEFMKKRWDGDGWADLSSAEYYTRVNLVWKGGNMNVSLPPVYKDQTSVMQQGSEILAVIPQVQKGGQLRNDFENCAIIGVGITKFEELVISEAGGAVGALPAAA